jgi:hypothetical protein
VGWPVQTKDVGDFERRPVHGCFVENFGEDAIPINKNPPEQIFYPEFFAKLPPGIDGDVSLDFSYCGIQADNNSLARYAGRPPLVTGRLSVIWSSKSCRIKILCP